MSEVFASWPDFPAAIAPVPVLQRDPEDHAANSNLDARSDANQRCAQAKPLHTFADLALAGPGFCLRRAGREDLPFLLVLYRSFRMAELIYAPWTLQQKHAFLDDQFRLQHQHFVTVFAGADFMILERDSEPIGRLYLDASSPLWLLVDIGLLPAWRGKGIGRALLENVQQEARVSGAASIRLHVAQNNPAARRLYERSGFVATGDEGYHTAMVWEAEDTAQLKTA